jgi:tetratricopeptide (TPR) repeat protein
VLSGVGVMEAEGNADQLWRESGQLYAVSLSRRQVRYHLQPDLPFRSIALMLTPQGLDVLAQDHDLPELVRKPLRGGAPPVATMRPIGPAGRRVAEELLAPVYHGRMAALYREANLLVSKRHDEKEYRPLLEQADSLLEQSAAKLALPETYALRSSVLGQLIGSNPLRGMTLGPRSGSAMDRAIELGPRNPRVWMLRGVGAMFTPTLFGGGVQKAEEYLRKAIGFFAEDRPVAPLPAWGHAEAYAWLGQALHKQKRIDDARAAYAKALELQPENGWVKHVLLPALDRGER